MAPAAWDRLLDDAAGGLGRGFGGAIVPTERVTNSALYASLDAVKDEVTDKLVERSWKQTRPVFPQSFA